MNKKIFFLVLVVFLLPAVCLWASQYRSGTHSPITLKIKLKKDTFEVGEPIDGKIEIQSTLAGGFPVVFNIKLYHDKALFSDLKTEFKRIHFGRTVFSFKDFGIPPFNDSPASQGEWNLSINQQDMDVSHARWVTIQIIAQHEDVLD
jgi:hypothetical protein